MRLVPSIVLVASTSFGLAMPAIGQMIAKTVGDGVVSADAGVATAASPQPQSTGRARHGHYRNGRYIGYVPKHEKQQPTTRSMVRSMPHARTGTPADKTTSPGVNPNALLSNNATLPSAATARQVQYTTAGEATVPTEGMIVSETPITEGMPIQQMPYVENGIVGGGEVIYDEGSYCSGPILDSGWPMLELWGRVELLSWWTQEMGTPILVTTSSDGTARDAAGVLGESTTSTLFGGVPLNGDSRTGGRFTLGAWLDPSHFSSLEFSYLTLAEERATFSGSDTDFNILARPFFNTQDIAEDARLIVFPSVVDGSLDVTVATSFRMGEIAYRRGLMQSGASRLQMSVGYRYANLDDLIRVEENTTSLEAPTTGTTISLFDEFHTENSFHGGQVGLFLVTDPMARWSMDLKAKFAMGSTQNQAIISGQRTSTTAQGVSSTTTGGLLAQASNIGAFENNEFSSVIEVGVGVRRRISCRLSTTFGYDFVHMSDVVRAGNIIDRQINTSQIPPSELTGTARPAFNFDIGGFWAQGLRWGLEYNY